LKKFLFLILLFLLIIPFADAEETFQYGIIKTEKGIGVSVRSGPGTERYEKIGTGISESGIIKVIDTINTDDESTGCSSGKWYKIEYKEVDSNVGYVCSSFVELKEIENQTTIKGKINSEKGVIVRSQATTNSDEISDGLSYNRTVTIVEEASSTDENDTCSTKTWYKIIYPESDNGYGYICSKFISVIDNNVDLNYNFEAELTKFPISYQKYLQELHSLHPNWKFYAINIDYTIEEITNIQATSSKSLINTSYEGWRSTNEGAYDYKTDTWKGFDGDNWKAASKEIVSYYLDPRNFLNEQRIFMFEDLSYHDYQNENGVQSILNGTFMENTFLYDNKNYKYSTTFIEAGLYSRVSPYVLAARVKQEVSLPGGKVSGSASGNVSGYIGYYNFFNVGAYAGNGNDAIINGLIYAKNKGWNSPYKSIVEGSVFIGDYYILRGQQTLYFQKFNVNPASDYTVNTHQYMTNIQAPYSEAYTTYKAYIDNNDIDKDIVFYIPVYKDMPEANYSIPDKGNPNNWLSDIKIDGISIENFDSEVIEYNYNTKNNIIKITASSINRNATINGLGEIKLLEGENKIDITVIAQNGAERIYSLLITKFIETEENIITIDEIVDKLDVKINEQFMGGIKLGTTYKSFNEMVLKQYEKSSVSLTDKDGNIKKTTFATGDALEISNGIDTKTYQIIIYGDLSGDGEITLADLLSIQKIILEKSNLSGVYLKAGDINKDGSITLADLLAVQKHLLGTEIVQ